MKRKKNDGGTAAVKSSMTIAKRGKYIFCYCMLFFAFCDIAKYLIINFDSIVVAFTIRDISGNEVLSANNWTLLFQDLGDRESTIWIALINTLKYFVLGVVKTFLAYIISYFLFKKLWGYKFFRVVFFLPSMISPVILIVIFKDLIKVNGPLWIALHSAFGYELPNFLADFSTATNVILFYTFWSGFGASLLIFVGAMNRIPQSVFEAGILDGCDSWKEFFYIVLPMGWETLSTMVMLSVVAIFMSTGPILYFTGGDYNTNTLAYWIFNQVRGGSYNYPSAVGIFFTLLAIPIVVLINRLMNRGNKNVEY